MTSILGAFSSLATAAMSGPLSATPSALASGTVAQGGLASALSEIGTAMQAAPPAIGTDPATMQARMGALVDREVAEGKLTTDQASQLKQLFATTTGATNGGTTGMSSTGTSSTGTSSTGTSSTGTGEGVGGAVQSVVDFLRDLRLTIKGHYSPGGGIASTAPVGALVSALA